MTDTDDLEVNVEVLKILQVLILNFKWKNSGHTFNPDWYKNNNRAKRFVEVEKFKGAKQS